MGASVVGVHTLGESGLPDFSGYWRLLRTEGFDEFCRELGFPWVVRKAALRFMGGGSSVDVIAQSSSTQMRVTSLNPKGSWTRTYDAAHETTQENAEGTACKTTAWWEGRVFCTRMEPPPSASFGTIESMRYLHGDFMVVKTVVKLRKSSEASMHWFYDRMILQQHLKARHGSLRKQANDYVPMMSPAYISRGSRLRLRPASPSSSPHGTMSKSPSDAELSSNLPMGIDATSRSIPKSDSRTRLATSEAGAAEKSVAKSDSRARLADAGGSGGNHFEAVQAAATAAATAADGSGVGTVPVGARWDQHAASGSSPHFYREISLSGYSSQPPPPQQQQQPTSDITFQPAAGPPLEPILSGTATRGSSGVVELSLPSAAALAAGGLGPSSNVPRVPSYDSLGGAAGTRPGVRGPFHVKSFSADSGRGLSPSDGRSSPLPWSGRSTPTHRASGATPLPAPEAELASKLQYYLDGRSISTVVPVATPNDTSEPQLLGMSPEQAEETAAKLRELETDMLLRRQDSRHGFVCCGLVISKQKNSLPDHLRVWEMTFSQ
eukprot:scaffold18.g2016.t1